MVSAQSRTGRWGPRKSANGAANGSSKKQKKNGKGSGSQRYKGKGTGGRPNLLAIQQGVGHMPATPFGGRGSWNDRRVFTAYMPQHLPLPRPVGGYLVVRDTLRYRSTSGTVLVGTFRTFADSGRPVWANTVIAHNIGGGLVPINGSGTVNFQGLSLFGPGGLGNAVVVPSAISVQILNKEAVQTSEGIVTASRSKQVLDLAGDSQTWASLFDNLQITTGPRLMSAAKLAFRGVTVDAIPMNLSALSDFRPTTVIPNGQNTWERATNEIDLEGFAPIWIYNSDNIELEYVVTVEYRVRFPPNNVASAAHVVYPAASDATWTKHIARMEAEGHGVRDIVDAMSGSPV